MGRMKQWMIEQMEQEEEAAERLAEVLGITYSELLDLKHKVKEDHRDGAELDDYCIYFDKNSPQYILDKIERLEENRYVYLSLSELHEYYDDFDEEYLAIVDNPQYYENFTNEIKNIRKLNDLIIEDFHLNNIQKRMLFVTTIATLETFLAETMINLIKEKNEYLRNFIESFPAFKDKEKKISISEIYNSMDKLHEIASREILEILYHRLHIVKNMFIDTFKINFPDIKELSKAVIKRHDIVHRNGKTKDGNTLIVDKNEVNELLTKVLNFGIQLAEELDLEKVTVLKTYI